MPKERRLVWIIWESFKQSLQRQPRTSHFGDFKGEDFIGNKYYELGARPEVGRRKPSRWFESKNKDYMQEIPIEWESWLRNRRDDAPTNEEIIRNRAIAEMKKKKNDKTETKEQAHRAPHRSADRPGNYPKYDDLESFPGQHRRDDS